MKLPRKMVGRVTRVEELQFFAEIIEIIKKNCELEFDITGTPSPDIDFRTYLDGTSWEALHTRATVAVSFPPSGRRRDAREHVIWLSDIARLLHVSEIRTYMHVADSSMVNMTIMEGSRKGVSIRIEFLQLKPLPPKKKQPRKGVPKPHPRRIVDLN